MPPKVSELVSLHCGVQQRPKVGQVCTAFCRIAGSLIHTRGMCHALNRINIRPFCCVENTEFFGNDEYQAKLAQPRMSTPLHFTCHWPNIYQMRGMCSPMKMKTIRASEMDKQQETRLDQEITSILQQVPCGYESRMKCDFADRILTSFGMGYRQGTRQLHMGYVSHGTDSKCVINASCTSCKEYAVSVLLAWHAEGAPQQLVYYKIKHLHYKIRHSYIKIVYLYFKVKHSYPN